MAKTPPKSPRRLRLARHGFLRATVRLQRQTDALARQIACYGSLVVLISFIHGLALGKTLRDVAPLHMGIAIVQIFTLLLARGLRGRLSQERRDAGGRTV